MIASIVIQMALIPIAGMNCRSDRPIAMAFGVAPIFGLVFFVASYGIGNWLNRPFAGLDAVRVYLWGIIGFALGTLNMTGGYHKHFWPHEASIIGSIARVVMGGALAAIVVTTAYSVAIERKSSK